MSLDEQLFDLLFREKICIDPDNLKPRCIKCNENQMVYVPEMVIRYIHYQMAVNKSIDSAAIDMDDLLKLQAEIENLDPREHSEATFLPSITHHEAIERNLRVMDSTALALCRDNGLPIYVFNMADEQNIDRIVSGERVGTVVAT